MMNYLLQSEIVDFNIWILKQLLNITNVKTERFERACTADEQQQTCSRQLEINLWVFFGLPLPASMTSLDSLR
jgi:hypothetical protein